MKRKRKKGDDAELDMTPMIDVVFQLMIFFVVTMKMEQNENKEIVLEHSPHGPKLEDKGVGAMVIEVDRRGWISVHGAQVDKNRLRELLRDSYQRYGTFPIYIRGDKNTKHEDIRGVMDICASEGIAAISFIAIKKEKRKR